MIFNTAVSFATNTNLQHYAGDASLSYFSQLFALMWLQFVSCATGISLLAALARGFSGRREFGNFYLDIMRSTFLILLPLAFLTAIVLVLAGMPMTLEGSAIAHTLEGAVQKITRGPVAAFVAIKQLGTNGGGFFGPNSTHPFENPSFFTNFVECLCILIIPAACVWMFGFMIKRKKHAAVIFCVMAAILVIKIILAVGFESEPTAAFKGLDIAPAECNLEGKELRFGADSATLWVVTTTAVQNGSVNCMHASLNPLTSLMALIGMWLNAVFGGGGVGLMNMLLYIIVGVFISGLMVGRTPEYLARKVETREMKFALLAILIHPLLILAGTAVFAATPWGTGTILNHGAWGFTEILYEFTSSAANNGSGFEGLGDATLPWNIATGLVMLIGRYVPIIFSLAIAGSLAVKKASPVTSGTLPTDTVMFGFIILGTILFVGALLFLPVAVLGPVAEHLAIHGG
jgi:K+-transporting ATPase ATPase A chain